MGKVKEAVREHMPNGSLIACDVAADFAITAGWELIMYSFRLYLFTFQIAFSDHPSRIIYYIILRVGYVTF